VTVADITLPVGVLRAGELGARGCFCSVPQRKAVPSLSEGALVLVKTKHGRSALARLGYHDDNEQVADDALLDRSLRLTLRVRVGDEITISCTETKAVDEVLFVPAADLSRALMEGIEKSLKGAIVDGKTPLSPGVVLYLRVRESQAGTFFKAIDLKGGPGIATEDTVVRVTYSSESQFTEVSQGVSYSDIGGLQTQLALVRELVELPLVYPYLFRRVGINPPKGLIFHGPPGTGKTHVAKAIAGQLEARFFYINGADVAGSLSVEAENALRRTFAEATNHAPAIIFIDEVDALALRRGESGLHSDTKIVSQLLSLMDGLQNMDGVTVIGTTNRIDQIDPAFRRPGRFEREILFTLPDLADRLAILDIHTREMPLAHETAEFLPDVAAATAGYTGADLMELCREAGLSAIRRAMVGVNPAGIGAATEISVISSDFRGAIQTVRPSSLREVLVERPTVRWTDIGGLHQAKQRLQELLSIRTRNPKLLRDLQLPSRVGILLHGPPGSGKTLLARAAASELGLHFLLVRGSEVFSKWLGESEQTVRRLFIIARQVAPCIIFFDHLEAVAPRRRLETETSAPERVLHQLLSELDNFEIDDGMVVMGAATSLDSLDLAVIRSGRLGQHIATPLPGASDRREILRIYLDPVRRWMKEDFTEAVNELSFATDGKSGADLRFICDDAKYRAALRATEGRPLEITRADLIMAGRGSDGSGISRRAD